MRDNHFSGQRKHTLLICGLFLILTFFAYTHGIDNGFIWDDETNLLNKSYSTLTDLKNIWLDPLVARHQYYPLTHSGFWVQYQLWGFYAPGYHFVSIALHAINAVLLWYFLTLIGVRFALWIGLVFALHPVHVESVAWITEQKNLLSLFFSLLCLIQYFKFNASKSREAYALAIVFFVCALLSKTAVVTLPLALLPMVWWKNNKLTLKDCLSIAPFLAVSFLSGLMTLWIEKHHLGSEWYFSSLERLLIIGRVFWFYPSKLIWPDENVFMYPRWMLDTGAAWQYLFPLFMVLAVGLTFKARKAIGKGPIACVLIYGILQLPASGIISHYMMRFSFVADHLNYIPSISLIVLMVGVIGTLLEKIHPRTVVMFMLGALLFLGYQTFHLCKIYKSPETLYTDVIAKNPFSFMARNNLGHYYAEVGRFDQAIEEWEKNLRLNPGYYDSIMNLGWLYNYLNKPQDARRAYLNGLKEHPDALPLKYELAKTYARLGQINQAIALYEFLTQADPSVKSAQEELTELYRKRQQKQRDGD